MKLIREPSKINRKSTGKNITPSNTQIENDKKLVKKNEQSGKIGKNGRLRYHLSNNDKTTTKTEFLELLEKLIKISDKSGYWLLGYHKYYYNYRDICTQLDVKPTDSKLGYDYNNMLKTGLKSLDVRTGNIEWTVYKMKTVRSLIRTLKLERKKELIIYSRKNEIHIRHILQIDYLNGREREVSQFSNKGNRVKCRDYFLRPITESRFNKLKKNDKYFSFDLNRWS